MSVEPPLDRCLTHKSVSCASSGGYEEGFLRFGSRTATTDQTLARNGEQRPAEIWVMVILLPISRPVSPNQSVTRMRFRGAHGTVSGLIRHLRRPVTPRPQRYG